MTTSIKAEVSAVCWTGAFRCVNTAPRRKNFISVHLSHLLTLLSNVVIVEERVKKVTAASHRSGKGYRVISKQSEVHHFAVRTIIHNWKTFKAVANLLRSKRPSKFQTQCMILDVQTNTSKTLPASVSMSSATLLKMSFGETRPKWQCLAVMQSTMFVDNQTQHIRTNTSSHAQWQRGHGLGLFCSHRTSAHCSTQNLN